MSPADASLRFLVYPVFAIVFALTSAAPQRALAQQLFRQGQ